MQDVIRNGTLRLMTSEASCDVILSCQGHRLMAHKIILSIASPLLQELLLADQSEISFLLFPDILASTMANILDYIYTGSVLLHSTTLTEFLSVANLLKLRVEDTRNTEPKLSITPEQNGVTNYSGYNYNKFQTGYDDTRYHKPNFEFKNSVCGPECFKSYPYKNPEEQICDYKLQEKGLKFSPIILQDERNPNLQNGGRLQENKIPINFFKPKETNQTVFQNTERDIPENNIIPFKPKDYPPSFLNPEINGFQNNNLNHPPINEMNQNGGFVNAEILNENLKEVNGVKKKNMRKVPNLMPISRFTAFKVKKGLYNRVFPSPWSPRIIPLVADPRNEYNLREKSQANVIPNGFSPNTDIQKENFEDQNDPNNNFKTYTSLTTSQLPPLTETPALNLIYREKHLSPTYTDQQTPLQPFERHTYTTEIKTVPKIPDVQNFKLVNHREIVYTSESNSSSCLSDVRVEEEVKKSEEEKEEVEKQKPYKCEECGKQFSQLRNYKYHRSVHEGTKEFAARCPECGKVFNDRGYLSSHLKIHRDRKEYGCPHCPKRFNQRVAYNMHLRIHTGVKPHVCPTCSKSFSRKMLLKQHQRVHTGERPYQCPECGKSFADRSNMSLHARLHTGVKPYACNLCPKSFTKKHHLKTHMNYHTGLKPYECQKCGLTFSQSSNMRTHYKKCVQKSLSEDITPVLIK